MAEVFAVLPDTGPSRVARVRHPVLPWGPTARPTRWEADKPPLSMRHCGEAEVCEESPLDGVLAEVGLSRSPPGLP